ncbi:MAG: hypothetical protein HON47_02685 [Candidatus Diapherotrites archaeon]|jgi:hypothetical protein|uniref:Uncharacterized protein n=1 Tax=Candidatus Iainarchaeum sp. TaxID=3101447 RepID=A0A8T5GEB0_9ARCH|nr:hypothetical protein [Candidatus Diapherotrites archaeon]MBT7241554.1 hypothetical protein [Candidatus Diapherotrites archaeon]
MKKTILILSLMLVGLFLFGCTEETNNNPNPQTNEPKSFTEYVNMYKTVNFKAEYESKSILIDENIVSQLNVYVLNDNFRMDRTHDDPGKNTIHIFNEEQAIGCINTTGTLTCYDTGMFSNKIELWGVTLLGVKEEEVIITPPQTIAGEETNCFTLDYPYNINTICFTQDGIIAKVKSIRKEEYVGNSKGFETTAISISRNVSDTDFIPPATIQESPL